MITREQAVYAAKLDGLRDDQLTDAVLKLYGYETVNPIAGVNTKPFMMDAETEQALKLLAEERKKNQNLGGPILEAIGKVVTFARTTGLIKWCLVAVLIFGCVGCGPDNTQARQTVAMVNDNFASYITKRDEVDEKLIVYFRKSEHERIELVFQDALNSLKTPRAVPIKKIVREEVVGADGQPAFREKEVDAILETHVVEENAVIALTRQKLRLIQGTEITVLEMRNMLREIDKDAQTASRLMAGLDAYFNNRVTTLDAIEQAQTGVISFMQMFMKDRAEREAPGVERLPELVR